MREIGKGDQVKVHYTGKLSDGTVFDTSKADEPLTFIVGEGKLIKGFEKAVIGMHEGEQKVHYIPSQDAYGEYRDELLLKVPKSKFPENIDMEAGKKLSINQKDGVSVPVIIKKTYPESVLLDANHPLAGKDLTFEIEVVEIHTTL
jgi:peptidylprolyl isomerase